MLKINGIALLLCIFSLSFQSSYAAAPAPQNEVYHGPLTESTTADNFPEISRNMLSYDEPPVTIRIVGRAAPEYRTPLFFAIEQHRMSPEQQKIFAALLNYKEVHATEKREQKKALIIKRVFGKENIIQNLDPL